MPEPSTDFPETFGAGPAMLCHTFLGSSPPPRSVVMPLLGELAQKLLGEKEMRF